MNWCKYIIIFLTISFTLIDRAGGQTIKGQVIDISDFDYANSLVKTVRLDNGLVYIASDIDIFQYDGIELSCLNLRDSLKANIIDLVAGIDNHLFISSENGVVKFNVRTRNLEQIYQSPLQKMDYNFTVGRLVGISGSEVIMYQDGRIDKVSFTVDRIHRALFFAGKVYVATSSGVFALDFNSFKNHDTKGTNIYPDQILDLHKTKNVLFAVSRDKILKLESGDNSFYVGTGLLIPVYRPKLSTNAFGEIILFDRFKYFWRFDNLNWKRHNFFESIDLSLTESVLKDDENIVWITTKRGVVALLPSSIFSLNEISNNSVGITQTKVSGEFIYARGKDNRLYKYKMENGEIFLSGAFDQIKYIAANNSQVYGLSSDLKQISLFQESDFLFAVEIIKPIHPENQKIFPVRSNEIVYQSASGDVVLIQEDKRIVIDSSEGLLTSAISGHEGNIFLGYSDGSILEYGNTNTTILHREKAGEGSFYGGVQQLIESKDSLVWVTDAKRGVGVISYGNNEIANISFFSLEQLSENSTIHNLFFDSQNRLWIFSSEGLILADVNKDEIKSSRVFGQSDGLPINNFKGENIVEDTEKNIWIACDLGFFNYNPVYDDPNLYKPKVYLSKVEVKEEFLFNRKVKRYQHSFFDSARIDADYFDKVIIHPRSTSLQGVGYAKVQINIDDEVSNWKEYDNNQEIELDDLKEGRNRILLRGVNNDNLPGYEVFVLDINVGAPIWKSISFLAYVSIALIVIGFSFYSFARYVRKRSIRAMEQKLVIQREQMDEEAHATILRAEKLQQLNDLILTQKQALEEKNQIIERNRYELELSNKLVSKQKDLLEETTKRLTSSIRHAQRIQTALMPPESHLSSIFKDFFILFKPRDVVSGDFYWFYFPEEMEGGKLVITAVDCTGHGVPGAFVSAMAINLLNAIVKHKKIVDAGQILTHLNNDLKEILRTGETKVNDGMDLALCSIDKTRNKILFSGAKNPLLIVNEDDIELVKGSAAPIGHSHVFGDIQFKTKELDIREDVAYYMFSDGFQDQFGGEDGRKFMSKNFRKLLQEVHKKPFEEQKAILEERLKFWMSTGHKQTDDILVMGFKF